MNVTVEFLFWKLKIALIKMFSLVSNFRLIPNHRITGDPMNEALQAVVKFKIVKNGLLYVN